MGNVRVRGHDYRGKSYYFITFGTLIRRHWLSRIEDGKVVLEPTGELLLETRRGLPLVMPHFSIIHGWCL